MRRVFTLREIKPPNISCYIKIADTKPHGNVQYPEIGFSNNMSIPIDTELDIFNTIYFIHYIL